MDSALLTVIGILIGILAFGLISGLGYGFSNLKVLHFSNM
jgi:predicted transporter